MNLMFLFFLPFAADPDNTSPIAFAEQREGPCVIRYFGNRSSDGDDHGFKVWFGKALTMKCAFHAEDFVGTNAIIARGNVLPAKMPMYCGLNTAFFDADDRLVACASGPLWEDRGVVEGDDVSLLLLASLPVGVEERITAYRAAFYESTSPINKSVFEDQRTRQLTVTRSDGTMKSSNVTRWKSDGELRNKPFTLRRETRLLNGSGNEDWRAVTGEDSCELKKLKDPRENIKQNDGYMKSLLPISFGTDLQLKVDCYCKLNLNNSIAVYLRWKNETDKELFSKVYLSFLDNHGNLISSVQATTNAAAKSINPEIIVNGELITGPASFHIINSTFIPRGLESKISAYKSVLYESETPIGKIQPNGAR